MLFTETTQWYINERIWEAEINIVTGFSNQKPNLWMTYALIYLRFQLVWGFCWVSDLRYSIVELVLKDLEDPAIRFQSTSLYKCNNSWFSYDLTLCELSSLLVDLMLLVSGFQYSDRYRGDLGFMDVLKTFSKPFGFKL